MSSPSDATPHRNDVLFGRGPLIMTHPGNLQFRSMVDAQRTQFQQEKVRKAKRAIATRIVDEIGRLRPPGRFLAERPGGGLVSPDGVSGGSCDSSGGVDRRILCKTWIRVDNVLAVKKTMHGLREKVGDEGKDEAEGKSTPPPDMQNGSDIDAPESDDDSFLDGIPEWHEGAGEQEWEEWESSLLSSDRPGGGPEAALHIQDGVVAGDGSLSHQPDAFDGFAQSMLESIPGGEGAGALKTDLTFDNNAEMSACPVDGVAPNASPVGPVGMGEDEQITEDMSPVAAEGETISVEEWMDAASAVPSNSTYMESAADLAYAITKHLCQLSSRRELTGDRVDAEQIVIFVERHSSSLLPGLDTPSIRGIKLKCELSDPSMAFLSERSARTSTSCHRAVCASLGRVLLYVFSRGGVVPTGQRTRGAEKEGAHEHQWPAAKRTAAATMASSPSSAVAKRLAELGVPFSICRLVADLLNADADPLPRTAITSLKEAQNDLTSMKNDPQSFLFDRTCPQRALDAARLYERDEANLFGRQKEMDALMRVKNKVSAHVHNREGAATGDGNSFLCETAFLGGFPGCGKSSLLRSLAQSCRGDEWFVVEVKYDLQVAPQLALVHALNELFGKWKHTPGDPAMAASLQQVSQRISSAVDEDGLALICDMMPNFAELDHSSRSVNDGQGMGEVTSMGKVGSSASRIRNLIHLVVHSICTSGRPMLLILDDLQWCRSNVLDGLVDFLNFLPGASGIGSYASRGGYFVAGSFRSNEVDEGGHLLKNINAIKESGQANVTMLDIGELSEADVNQLLSTKLSLPRRYTRDLAAVVHSKTRGNPFHIVQFLRTIVSNKMLQFSVKARRWGWDCDVVDLQMISEGVAELLTASFNQLPSQVRKTIKIVACLGYQVERATIDALDSTQKVLPFCMLDQMELATKEGILERAGPIYQFTHDIIKQTIYDLIPPTIRSLLHKSIGKNLLEAATNNPAIHLLAVAQINLFCKDGTPSPEERAQFASCNSQAAKYAIAGSSFEEARSYIDAGIKMLEANHWETQYTLSLSLFVMSASLCWMQADTATMAERLDDVIKHSKTFDDSLPASCLLVKLLASTSDFDAARKNCGLILSKLGVNIPPEVNASTVQNELKEMGETLRSITYDQMKALPPMTNETKRNAMKVSNLLCSYSVTTKPMLVPIVAFLMLKLTLQYGFCDDSIVALASAGYSVLLFGDESQTQLAINLGKVSECLIAESPRKHALQTRLCHELMWTLRTMTEPMQSVVALYPDLYSSAIKCGQMDDAVLCRVAYCAGLYWTGANLDSVASHCALCIKESAHYHQTAILYLCMSYLNSCCYLTGKESSDVSCMSMEELRDIGEKIMPILEWQVFVHMCGTHFWSRDYRKLAELSARYRSEQYPHSQQRRILHVIQSFYEGIAFLWLARTTQQSKYRTLGERAVNHAAEMTSISRWNWENKAMLLQAELFYVDGDLLSAEAAYKASIMSAHEHKFVHEEALAYELHGVFCVENGMVTNGLEQLRHAKQRYEQWGAAEVAKRVQRYINAIAGAKGSVGEGRGAWESKVPSKEQ